MSSGPCLAAVEKAIAETDVGAILPLGRQHSLLNIINVVIQKLGHLIHSYLPKVLQILLCVTASVSTALDSRDQVIRLGIDTTVCLFLKGQITEFFLIQYKLPRQLETLLRDASLKTLSALVSQC